MAVAASGHYTPAEDFAIIAGSSASGALIGGGAEDMEFFFSNPANKPAINAFITNVTSLTAGQIANSVK